MSQGPIGGAPASPAVANDRALAGGTQPFRRSPGRGRRPGAPWARTAGCPDPRRGVSGLRLAAGRAKSARNERITQSCPASAPEWVAKLDDLPPNAPRRSRIRAPRYSRGVSVWPTDDQNRPFLPAIARRWLGKRGRASRLTRGGAYRSGGSRALPVRVRVPRLSRARQAAPHARGGPHPHQEHPRLDGWRLALLNIA